MALTLLSYVHREHLAISVIRPGSQPPLLVGLARPDSNTAAQQPRLIYRHIIRWVETGEGQPATFSPIRLQLFILEIERIIDEEVFP